MLLYVDVQLFVPEDFWPFARSVPNASGVLPAIGFDRKAATVAAVSLSTRALLLVAAVPLLWRSRGGGGIAWAALGLACCAAGQALRAWVLGQVPDGTSGPNERLIATELNTAAIRSNCLRE